MNLEKAKSSIDKWFESHTAEEIVKKYPWVIESRDKIITTDKTIMKKSNNMITDWLEQHGDTEIDRRVEMEIKNIRYGVLEDAVEQWAEEKGILEKATPIKQALKTQEEVLELQNAIVDDDREEIQDALGDILVTIIIQAKMQGLDLLDCLQSAYDVISKRTGTMKNGQFVKD